MPLRFVLCASLHDYKASCVRKFGLTKFFVPLAPLARERSESGEGLGVRARCQVLSDQTSPTSSDDRSLNADDTELRKDLFGTIRLRNES